MSTAPLLRPMFDPPNEIVQAGLDGDLVLFIGAGASRRLGLPSWSGLSRLVLHDLRQAGLINYSDLEQLRGLDAKKQLSIAHLIAKQNDFVIDYSSYLSNPNGESTIYADINKIGCPCVTTNYDELLEPVHLDADDGSETPTAIKRIVGAEKLYAKHLNDPGCVVHLHGAISDSDFIIVTTRDYLEHYDKEKTQEFLRELFTKKVVLFIGYGLEEAEILELILRKGDARDNKENCRFALQGFFLSEQPLYNNLYSYYEKSFGVQLLGYVRDYDGYAALDKIIRDWSNQLEIRKPPLAVDLDFMDEVLSNG